MYPIVQPGALVLIDESRRKIVNSGWTNEHERPIYFFELRGGYASAGVRCMGANWSCSRIPRHVPARGLPIPAEST